MDGCRLQRRIFLETRFRMSDDGRDEEHPRHRPFFLTQHGEASEEGTTRVEKGGEKARETREDSRGASLGT